MTTPLPMTEGYLSFRDFKIWYRIIGHEDQSGKLPLLCLHGGPGAAHDYLEPLQEIARSGRRVIVYDQLGCGNSDHPHDPSLWTAELFVEELAIVRKALDLDHLHLFGQSWGGMLAMQYALTKPTGIASLILASAPASMRQWADEANRLRSELPPEVQQILLHHEDAGTTDDPAYVDAMMLFYRRHLCRMDPWPDCLNRTFDQLMRDPEVYLTMCGPSEFHIVGNLKDWDITDRLPEIALPTLITSGRYDEATPAIAATLQAGIPGSTSVIFEESGHEAHLEETALYLHTLNAFLTRVESQCAQELTTP